MVSALDLAEVQKRIVFSNALLQGFRSRPRGGSAETHIIFFFTRIFFRDPYGTTRSPVTSPQNALFEHYIRAVRGTCQAAWPTCTSTRGAAHLGCAAPLRTTPCAQLGIIKVLADAAAAAAAVLSIGFTILLDLLAEGTLAAECLLLYSGKAAKAASAGGHTGTYCWMHKRNPVMPRMHAVLKDATILPRMFRQKGYVELGIICQAQVIV